MGYIFAVFEDKIVDYYFYATRYNEHDIGYAVLGKSLFSVRF